MRLLNNFLFVALSLILLCSCATYRSNFDPKLIEIIDDIIDNPDQLRNYYDYHPQLKFKDKDSVFDFTKDVDFRDILEKAILRIKEFNKSWKPYQFHKSAVSKTFKEDLKKDFKIHDDELLGISIISIGIKKSKYGYGVEFSFIKFKNEYKLLYVNEYMIFGGNDFNESD